MPPVQAGESANKRAGPPRVFHDARTDWAGRSGRSGAAHLGAARRQPAGTPSCVLREAWAHRALERASAEAGCVESAPKSRFSAASHARRGTSPGSTVLNRPAAVAGHARCDGQSGAPALGAGRGKFRSLLRRSSPSRPKAEAALVARKGLAQDNVAEVRDNEFVGTGSSMLVFYGCHAAPRGRRIAAFLWICPCSGAHIAA